MHLASATHERSEETTDARLADRGNCRSGRGGGGDRRDPKTMARSALIPGGSARRGPQEGCMSRTNQNDRIADGSEEVQIRRRHDACERSARNAAVRAVTFTYMPLK